MKLKGLFIFFFLTSTVQASTSLSFDEALEKILDRNTEIKIQQTQVNAADYGVLQKKAAFLPTLSVTGQRGDGLTDGVYNPPSQSASINGSINLFRWTSDARLLEGSEEDLHSQKDTLENIRLTTEQVGIETLAAQIQTIQEIEVLKRNADVFNLYLNIAQQRFAKGLLPSQEVDKVALDSGNAEARLQDAESRLALAKANLARLLGSVTDIKDDWPWKSKLKIFNTSDKLKASPDFSERPDIRAATDLVNAENARLKADYWSQYPAIDFSASQGFSENEDGSSQQSTTSLAITLPLFDKLSHYSRYKIQYENYAAADLRLRQLRLDAESQWSAAREQFAISLRTAIDRDKSLEISQRLYHTNEQRFKQGRANANDLEVDHSRLIEASLLAIAGWSSTHIQFAKFCHSLGRSVKKCD